MSDPVLVLVRDLLLSSKIIGSGRDLGIAIRLVRDPRAVPADARARLLMVDLNLDGAIEFARGWLESGKSPVIGFVSHTDAATIDVARQAAITNIMPRSRFFELLPELLIRVRDEAQ
jgi:hypothetical protein